jgi:hypothetical protein
MVLRVSLVVDIPHSDLTGARCSRDARFDDQKPQLGTFKSGKGAALVRFDNPRVDYRD